MKTKIILTISALAIIATSFKLSIDKASATSEQKEGIQVFCYSKPVSKYDILGMVKVKGMVKSEKGPHMVELLVGYAKKEYPSGEGIIVNSEFEKAEVIRFKD
jgi:hypothetical protein